MAKYETWIPAIQSRGVCSVWNNNATDLEVVDVLVKSTWSYGLRNYVVHIRRNHKRVVCYRVQTEPRIEQV